jgi:hypothetical protein
MPLAAKRTAFSLHVSSEWRPDRGNQYGRRGMRQESGQTSFFLAHRGRSLARLEQHERVLAIEGRA